MRKNEHHAVLIPVKDQEHQYNQQERVKTVEAVFEKLEAWKQKNRKLIKQVSKGDSALLIRKMRSAL
jgi:hypothetical protein